MNVYNLLLVQYNHILLKILSDLLYTNTLYLGGVKLSGKNMDMTERISKIGETINKYRESVMALFKDMDVEVKDWHVSVGKMEKEYDIDVTLKLAIKPKKA